MFNLVGGKENPLYFEYLFKFISGCFIENETKIPSEQGYNKWKDMVTNETIMLREMYQDAREVKNPSKFMILASTERPIAKMTADERRAPIFKALEHNVLNVPYWNQLYETPKVYKDWELLYAYIFAKNLVNNPSYCLTLLKFKFDNFKTEANNHVAAGFVDNNPILSFLALSMTPTADIADNQFVSFFREGVRIDPNIITTSFMSYQACRYDKKHHVTSNEFWARVDKVLVDSKTAKKKVGERIPMVTLLTRAQIQNMWRIISGMELKDYLGSE